MSKNTKKFSDVYVGKSMKDLPELAALVERKSIDAVNWVIIYQCKESGELWEEKYEAGGHGDVPTVRRIKSSE